MTIHNVTKLIKDAGVKFIDDDGPRLGAALAYYTALSLSPLVVVTIAIVGWVYGPEAARGEVVEELRDVVGHEGAKVIEQLVAHSAIGSGGIVATVVAFGVAFFGASGVFSELRDSLHSIWKVPGRESTGGILSLIRGKLLSFTLVCGTAFLLLVSLVVSAILSGINDRIAGWLPGMTVLAEVTNFVLTLVTITLLFAMIFKWLPETDLAWSDVWLGAFVTATLFSVGKYLIGLYLGTAAVGSAYGAAGAFVLLLVWVYYSAQILLFGAELTFIYAEQFGSGVGEVQAAQQAGACLGIPA